MRLSDIPKDDFLWGSMYGSIALFYLSNPLAILVFMACVVLWIIGGQIKPSIRRYGCSIAMGASLMTITHERWLVLLASIISIGLLSIGYGIKSINDEGSRWGNLWLKLVGSDSFLTTLLARGTLILGCHLSYFLAIKVF